jgi:hypothetical protein
MRSAAAGLDALQCRPRSDSVARALEAAGAAVARRIGAVHRPAN